MPKENSMNIQKFLHTKQITSHNTVTLQLMYLLTILTYFSSV